MDSRKQRKQLVMPGKLLLLVALLPFALASLVPKGMMLDTSDTDAIQIVICTSHGLTTISLGPDGTPIEDRPDKERSPCAWAFHAQPALGFPAAEFLSAPLVDKGQQARLRKRDTPPVGQKQSHRSRAPPLTL